MLCTVTRARFKENGFDKPEKFTYQKLTCICTGCVGIDIGIGCAAETATIDPGAAEPGGTCIGCPVGTIRVGVRFIGGPTGVTP